MAGGVSSIEKKIDEIFSRLDEIEKRIGIQPKKLSDFLEDSYSIKMHLKFSVVV